MIKQPKIVIIGAGAIGGSVGAWIGKEYKPIYMISRGENGRIIKKKGITTFPADYPDKQENVPVKVANNIEEVKDADVIVIGVKNYNLESLAKDIYSVVGDKPIIVGMQNGIENQRILPKYFSKIVYCVVGYNAWIEKPGLIGYQKKGPLVLGTLNNNLNNELHSIASIFNLGLNTIITDRFQDVAHTKLIINLANSVTTLLGDKFHDRSQQYIVQKLFTGLLLEGIEIVKTAGFKEYKINGIPSWRMIRLLDWLPYFFTKNIFRKNLKKMVISSMAQDVIQRGKKDTEIESLNGYMLELADKNKVKAPFNRTIYEISKREFSKSNFTPLEPIELWNKIKK